jgi:hypothetical protein
MAFFSEVHSLTSWHCKLCRNTEGTKFLSLLCSSTLHVFWQKFTLEDAIGSHACSLQASSEASRRVTNFIPLSLVHFLTGSHCKLRTHTLKAFSCSINPNANPPGPSISGSFADVMKVIGPIWMGFKNTEIKNVSITARDVVSKGDGVVVAQVYDNHIIDSTGAELPGTANLEMEVVQTTTYAGGKIASWVQEYDQSMLTASRHAGDLAMSAVRVFDKNLPSWIPLCFTTLLHFKCCQACDQCHSSWVSTFLPVHTQISSKHSR